MDNSIKMGTKKISLERINDAVNFKATNEAGQSILLDGTPDLGGIGNGVRPMETLLMALAGCSAIDIVMILGKMRQKLEDIKLDITGTTEQVEDYTAYTNIYMQFEMWGDLKNEKVERAIQLSIDKYCSVAKALDNKSEISFDFNIHDPK